MSKSLDKISKSWLLVWVMMVKQNKCAKSLSHRSRDLEDIWGDTKNWYQNFNIDHYAYADARVTAIALLIPQIVEIKNIQVRIRIVYRGYRHISMNRLAMWFLRVDTHLFQMCSLKCDASACSHSLQINQSHITSRSCTKASFCPSFFFS